MYQLKTVADFDSAHFSFGISGKMRQYPRSQMACGDRNSGGTSGNARPDGEECSLIFGDLKRDLKKLADEFDHTLIYESGTLREKTVEALLKKAFG